MTRLQPTPTVFPWIRYWSPRGQTPTVADGYLIGPESNVGFFEPKQNATLSTLGELGDVPCLVLLGDVGTGKSFEIAAEAQRVRRTEDSSAHATLLLDLKRRNSALIEKEAFSSPEFIGWVEGRHDLTLLFDSMDECWRRITELGPVLLAGFRPHLNKPNGRRLRLRISCRGAEWQEEIESELCRAFGEHAVGKKVQVWQIAPLTKENVSAAATACGLDARRFLAEVAERDVDALAAHPITLRMLLDIARTGGALGGNRAEIYSAGIGLLSQDTHQVPQGVPRLKSTAADRSACAGHVAALCVLTNRYLIFGSGEHLPVDGTGVVAGADLLGRKAHGPLGPLEFTREFLAETLQTALFDSQPNGIFTWRHQSYAEYLAARYLSQCPVPTEQLAQLLCDTSVVRPRISA